MKRAWQFLSLALIAVVILSGCVSKEAIQQKAYQDVLNELRANNYPVGLLGGTWYMTESDLRHIFPDLGRLDTNTLQRDENYYGQPVWASYVFKDGLLVQIIVTFKNTFRYMSELVANYENVQVSLSSDYGKMPQYTKNDLSITQSDQEYLISTKSMGRVTLVHRIVIMNKVAGEQITMFLGAW